VRACIVLASLRGFDELAAHLNAKRVLALPQGSSAPWPTSQWRTAPTSTVFRRRHAHLYGVPAARAMIAARRARRRLAAARRAGAAQPLAGGGRSHAAALGLVSVAAGEC
jgi:hypothetical protein